MFFRVGCDSGKIGTVGFLSLYMLLFFGVEVRRLVEQVLAVRFRRDYDLLSVPCTAFLIVQEFETIAILSYRWQISQRTHQGVRLQFDWTLEYRLVWSHSRWPTTTKFRLDYILPNVLCSRRFKLTGRVWFTSYHSFLRGKLKVIVLTLNTRTFSSNLSERDRTDDLMKMLSLGNLSAETRLDDIGLFGNNLVLPLLLECLRFEHLRLAGSGIFLLLGFILLGVQRHLRVLLEFTAARHSKSRLLDLSWDLKNWGCALPFQFTITLRLFASH